MRRLCPSPWLRRIAAPANLWAAWRTVRQRRGGPGVDGVTIAAFAAREADHLRRLEQQLLAHTYAPSALKRVTLAKRHGRQRQIGVPCVADRVVQQAMLRVLGPHFEPTFGDCNYGFRTGRNAHQAVQAVVKLLRMGLTWVVETDIEAFFDTLDWPRLRGALAAEMPDEAVLDLIHRFVHAGGFSGAGIANRGVPQGTGCSPLLANVYLTGFDRTMASQGGGFVRYGDDMVSLHRSRRAATAALGNMRQCLEGDLHLRLHPGKTRIIQARRQGFDFLSFRFTHTALEPSPDALQRFQSRVAGLVGQTHGQSPEARAEALNPLIRGWGEYFKIADVNGLYRELDAWLWSLLQLDPQAAPGHSPSLASLVAIKHRYTQSGQP